MAKAINQPPKYTVEQLQTYIRLSEHFQGAIDSVKVSPDVIVWFDELRENQAKVLNINISKLKTPKFHNIKLESNKSVVEV